MPDDDKPKEQTNGIYMKVGFREVYDLGQENRAKIGELVDDVREMKDRLRAVEMRVYGVLAGFGAALAYIATHGGLK